MTDQQHPITPPLALIDQWWDEAKQNAKYDEPIGPLVATKAAQWGADQELEASLEWLDQAGYRCWGTASILRAARRPKPSSLKERIAAAITAGDERTALSLLNEALPND